MKLCTLSILLLAGIFIILVISNRSEKCCGARREGLCSQNGCSPFLYPDMYSPLASCSDPFAWGDYFTTGRCGTKVERPVLRN